MDEPISRERADLIVRQFHRYEAYFARHGVDRRHFLRIIAMGGAAAVVLPVLQACGTATPAEVAQATAKPAAPSAGQPTSAAATPATAAAAAPKRGGRAIIGTLGEAQTINPLLANETEGQWRDKMLFEELVEIDLETLKPSPNIAQSWQVSDDATQYTFTLLKVTDGTLVRTANIEVPLQLCR